VVEKYSCVFISFSWWLSELGEVVEKVARQALKKNCLLCAVSMTGKAYHKTF
jgi:hypothetical protein